MISRGISCWVSDPGCGSKERSGTQKFASWKKGGWSYRLAFQGGPCSCGECESWGFTGQLWAFTLVVAYPCSLKSHLGIGNIKVTLSCLVIFHLWNHHGFPNDVDPWAALPHMPWPLRGRAFVDTSIRWARLGLKKIRTEKVEAGETSRMNLGGNLSPLTVENYQKVRKDTENAEVFQVHYSKSGCWRRLDVFVGAKVPIWDIFHVFWVAIIDFPPMWYDFQRLALKHSNGRFYIYIYIYMICKKCHFRLIW